MSDKAARSDSDESVTTKIRKLTGYVTDQESDDE